MRKLPLAYRASIVVAALACSAARANAFDNTSLAGRVSCSSTVFVRSSAVAAAQIALVADGRGTYLSGAESYRLPGGGTCDYVLDNGTYQVNPDGSGQSTTDWILVGGNSMQSCAHVMRGSASAFSLVDRSFSADLHGNLSESGTCAQQQSLGP